QEPVLPKSFAMTKRLPIVSWIVPKEFLFETRFILYSSFFTSIFGFLSIFLNASLGLEPGLMFVAAFSGLAYCLLYLVGRFMDRYTLVKYLFSGFSLFIINVLWFLNYGSKGPAASVFVVFFSLLTFIWDEKALLKISALLILNIAVFYLLDFLYPNLTGEYPSESARRTDFYLALMFFLGVIFILSYTAKKYYRMENENAKRSDKLKSAFLANMSHEIRTPLNSIVGFSELLCDNDMPEDKRERFIHIIQENNVNLLRLIDDILDISRIESNQLSISIQLCNLPDFLVNLETSYSKHKILKDKPKLKVRYNRSKDDLVIQTDLSRLHQIMVNLLDNSLKFTDKGVIEFGYEEKGKFVEFYVKDSGIGIKKENIENLFDRFFKIDHLDGKLYKGTGIGLSLCKDIITLLGGKIWVESEFESGTTFYFTLPNK
ncbi:hypothetical protein KY321_00315, partial [Candidatus Woesearchaeota archaeon]|nr:hypothetical protein [Candidatus Woesearchaeota archaeon]